MKHFLYAFALAMLSSEAGYASNTITVRVTVDAASTFGVCWDSPCGKPDLFVVFYGPSSTPACTGSSVPDHVYVSPPPPDDWHCAISIDRPGKLHIALFDGDGPDQDNTRGQQVDVAPGPDRAVSVDLETLAANPGVPFTFTSFGGDGTITYTVSAAIN